MQSVTRKRNSKEGGTHRRNKDPVSLPSHITRRDRKSGRKHKLCGRFRTPESRRPHGNNGQYHLLNVLCLLML